MQPSVPDDSEASARSLASGWLWRVVAIVAACALTGYALATRGAAQLTPDSVSYLAAARNLADGHGLTDFTGGALTHFPPGLSVLLAGAEKAGVSALRAGRLLNALACVAVIVLMFLLLRRHVRSPLVLVAALLLVAFSPRLLNMEQVVSSDPLFLILVLAFLLVIEDCVSGASSRAWLIGAAAALSWAAFLVRYAGGSFLVAGTAILLLVPVHQGFRKALGRAGAFAALGAVVPLAWAVHTTRIGSGAMLGLRVPSNDSIPQIARSLARAASQLVVPEGASTALLAAGSVVLLGGALALAWVSRDELIPRLRTDVPSILPILVFVLVYVAFAAIARRSTGSDLAPRILFPAWLPAVVLGAWFVDRLLTALRASERTNLTFALGGAALVILVPSTVWYLDQVQLAKAPATTYAASPLNAVTRREIADLPSRVFVASNDPWRVYSASSREPVGLAPMKLLPGFSIPPMTADKLAAIVAHGPVELVWFDLSPAGGSLPVDGMLGRDRFVLRDRRAFPGGVRYRLALAPVPVRGG